MEGDGAAPKCYDEEDEVRPSPLSHVMNMQCTDWLLHAQELVSQAMIRLGSQQVPLEDLWRCGPRWSKWIPRP